MLTLLELFNRVVPNTHYFMKQANLVTFKDIRAIKAIGSNKKRYVELVEATAIKILGICYRYFLDALVLFNVPERPLFIHL